MLLFTQRYLFSKVSFNPVIKRGKKGERTRALGPRKASRMKWTSAGPVSVGRLQAEKTRTFHDIFCADGSVHLYLYNTEQIF